MCASMKTRYYYKFFFFFSSRRRHTRSLCDWSSDVCSSDLVQVVKVHQSLENYLCDLANLIRSRSNLHRYKSVKVVGVLVSERSVVVILDRSEEHTSELQSHSDLVCRLLLEKKKKHFIKNRV